MAQPVLEDSTVEQGELTSAPKGERFPKRVFGNMSAEGIRVQRVRYRQRPDISDFSTKL